MASPIKLKDILACVGQFAPWELAEPWDNAGLLVGNPDQEAKGVLIALDPTLPVIEEAILKKANIILTHHPLIFHPLKSINTATPSGQFLQKALVHDIAVVSCHTNLDIVSDGVSDALARALYLRDTRPLRLTGSRPDQGFGRIGNLPTPMPTASFIDFAAQRLKLQGLLIAGPRPAAVSTVAVCGGSGSEFAEAAWQAGADIYITAELKHAVARWAEDTGLCVIDAGHFATENIIIPALVEHLTAFFSQNNNPAPVLASQRQNSPLRFHIFDNISPTT